MFEFGGQWSMTLKNRGAVKKRLRGRQYRKTGAVKKRLRGRQCRKTGAVVWQWVPTFKEAGLTHSVLARPVPSQHLTVTGWA